ncbi:MAG: thiol-disulfide oxidoreductase DCC family protein [Longimicrobiales bacterium]|nr:thiol-disulfide oxidoreductase DCC family protein [Longimicrobiales bacterium]
MTRPDFKKVILFDGVCVLCSAAVNFVIKRDRRDVFRFVPLQSEVGSRLAALHQISAPELSSIVMIEENRFFTKSSAVLRIAKELPGGYPFLHWLIAVPRPIRDAVYDLVARHRYRWFGKKERCMLPAPEARGRFLV